MNLKNQQTRGILLIAMAGIFWGTLGSFVTLMIQAGLQPSTIVFIRLFLGGLTMVIYATFVNPSLLKIDGRGLLMTVLMGLVTQAGFNILYFSAVEKVGIASSAVLLYTAPLFLTLWSVLIFKEFISKQKIISLLLCFIGCLLAITGGDFNVLQLSAVGIVLGVLSAVAYSLMSVMSRMALKRYSATTIMIYSFIFGALSMLPFARIQDLERVVASPMMMLVALGLGIVPTVLSYLFYFRGLSKGVELSKVGVISSLEMVISLVLALGFFGETLSAVKIIGVVLILTSIVLINGRGRVGDALKI